jgi:hypothetical protein
MGVEVNGIAHIQLTVPDAVCIPFRERLCHFLDMRTLIKADEIVYCIGGRTGILVRADAEAKERGAFDQRRAGLHHLCSRARRREDVDAVHRFAADELGATIVHPPRTTDSRPGTTRYCSRIPRASASKWTTCRARGTSDRRAGWVRAARDRPVRSTSRD